MLEWWEMYSFFASFANLGHWHQSRKRTRASSCDCHFVSSQTWKGFHFIGCRSCKSSTWPPGVQSQSEKAAVSTSGNVEQRVRKFVRTLSEGATPETTGMVGAAWKPVSPPSTSSLQLDNLKSQACHSVAELPVHPWWMPGQSCSHECAQERVIFFQFSSVCHFLFASVMKCNLKVTLSKFSTTNFFL